VPHLAVGSPVRFGPGHMRVGLVLAVVLSVADPVSYVVLSESGGLQVLRPDECSAPPARPRRNPSLKVK
jgi:hypothetical protein